MSQPPAPLPPSAAHDNISGGIKGFTIVITVVTIVSISLRFWSRCIGNGSRPGADRFARRLWWDDWAALAAVPFILGLCGLSFAMGFYGLGHHIQFVEPKDLFIFLRLLYAVYYVYDIGLFFTKLSALLFFSRIFPWHANAKWFNYTIVVTHGLNCAWLLGIIFGTVFMCNPVEKGWNPMLPGKCGPTSALWLGSAIPSVTIDLIILLLPLPKIWSLQMTRTRKLAIIGVFVIGYSVIVVSIGRLITVLLTGNSLNSDITYSVVHLAYWVAAEAPITILCICLPPMAALGRYLANNYFSKLSSKVQSLFSTNKGSKASSVSHSRPGNYYSNARDTYRMDTQSSSIKKSSDIDIDGHSLESQEIASQHFYRDGNNQSYAGARADNSYVHDENPLLDGSGIRVDRVVTVTQKSRK